MARELNYEVMYNFQVDTAHMCTYNFNCKGKKVKQSHITPMKAQGGEDV
jgi:hypothetical protein